MSIFVALLRGINVSGRKIIRMAKLKESLQALGGAHISTYLQSGNVVFYMDEGSEEYIAQRLKERINTDFGHDIEVLVMKAESLRQLIDSNLIPCGEEGRENNLFHATLFLHPMEPEVYSDLKLPIRDGEKVILTRRAAFLYCPEGYGKTKLSNSFFEKKLSISTTTRNWRTICALMALCDAKSAFLSQ